MGERDTAGGAGAGVVMLKWCIIPTICDTRLEQRIELAGLKRG